MIEKINHSEGAAPLVVLPTSDSTVRICGDYKATVNQSLEVDSYPMPRPQDLMASLTGGKKFTKLDLSSAYQQMSLAEEARQYVTINTHHGLCRFTRLPFGVASAPTIIQKAMDTLSQGLPNVICYLDDIFVTGATDQEHLQNLRTVLTLLLQNGLQLHQSKLSLSAVLCSQRSLTWDTRSMPMAYMDLLTR